jgi:hypothetical protein
MLRSAKIITVLLLSLPVFAHGDAGLYGPQSISPYAVRQGSMGSCYFYASVAALAAAQPDSLRLAIGNDGNGDLRVRFADGKIEQIHAEDVQFARKSNFDRSEGLWVAVLFRGYAQRTLRTALTQAVHASSLPPPLKNLTSGIFADSDLVLLAYDRAIRSQIDQSGDINRDGLKAQLSKELAAVPLLGLWKDRAVEMMDSYGFFESLAAQVKANGELFGAYRAVGRGGESEQVLSAFAGDAHSYEIKNRDQSAAAISQALQKHQAVVAWTGDSPLDSLPTKARSLLGDDAEDWYIDAHAYTVLAVDTSSGTVTIRNPWGNHPDPQGEFTLPLDVFSAAYTGFSTSAPSRGVRAQN